MNRSMANGDMSIVDFGLDDLDLEFGIFWIRCHASSTSRRDFACSKKQEAKFWRERVANSTWHCEYSTWPGVKVPPPEFHVAGESKQRSRIQIPRGSSNRVALEYLLLPDAGLPTMMIRLQRNLQDNPVYIIVYRLIYLLDWKLGIVLVSIGEVIRCSTSHVVSGVDRSELVDASGVQDRNSVQVLIRIAGIC